MGMDISCVGGIGFEISDLLSMYPDHELAKQYYNEEDEDLDHYELLDDFVENHGAIELQALHSYEDTEYYILADDPITGVQAFIDEMISLGFEDLTIDDLKFYSEARVW